MDNTHESQSGKTYPEPCQVTAVTTLRQSSGKWLTWGAITWNGLSSTHSSSESPNGVDECSSSLSLILQSPQNVHPKYLLSEKAVQGIAKREKETLLRFTGPMATTTNGKPMSHHPSNKLVQLLLHPNHNNPNNNSN